MESIAGNKKTIIIDYGMGNLFSVKLACEKVGLRAEISNNKKEILEASALILPGVGAFGRAMENLENFDLVPAIKKYVDSGKPFLGICLGIQLLFTESEEFGNNKGLDLIKGKVVKFPASGDKVPQVGWNKINKTNDFSQTLLKGLSDKDYMYFVHSFYCIPDSEDLVLTKTNYAGIDYCSSLQYKNIFACQFHPEKSGEKGLLIYKNFKNAIK